MKFYSYREAFGKALVDLGKKNNKIVVIDADVKTSTRTHYFEQLFPERFFQVGISEQDMVSTAAGFAVEGFIPIISTFAVFMMRGWEQIRNVIARDNLKVIMAATHSGLSDFMDGSSHQCFEDIALTRVLPNMTVVSPADDVSVKPLLEQAVEWRGPVYFRLGRDNAVRIYDPREASNLKLGVASVLSKGDDANILSYGPMVAVALRASEILKRRGYSVGVVDFHTIKPLDGETLIKLSNSLLVTLEDHSVYCGLGGAAAEFLSENKPTRVIRIGMKTFGRSARSYSDLLEFYSFTPEAVAKKIEEALRVA